MKQMTKTKSTALRVLLLGVAASAARGLLYLTAVDDKGLLIRSHPLCWLLWALGAAAAVMALVQLNGKKCSPKYDDTFAPGLPAAVGSLAMAVGVVLTVLSGNPIGRGNLVLLWNLSGAAAALGLVWAGVSQTRTQKPFLGVYAVLCLFFALHMVSRYQPWSGEPQAMDWVFSLLSAIGLTLCAYHRAAFLADAGHRRTFLAEGLATVFACCAALPHTDYFWLYLGGLVWVFTGLWSMGKPVPAQPAQED